MDARRNALHPFYFTHFLQLFFFKIIMGQCLIGLFFLHKSNNNKTNPFQTHPPTQHPHPPTKKSRFKGNKAGARDGGAVFALDSNTNFRGCAFGGNAARKGEDLYNHGGLAEVYCAKIGRTYNKPKVRREEGGGRMVVGGRCLFGFYYTYYKPKVIGREGGREGHGRGYRGCCCRAVFGFYWGGWVVVWGECVCVRVWIMHHPPTPLLFLSRSRPSILPPPHPPPPPQNNNTTHPPPPLLLPLCMQVGGHIVQDCFLCPAGRYGDFESAGSPVCEF